MRLQSVSFVAVILALQALDSPAAVLHVDLNSTNPTPPFSNWSSAATNIQDAIDVANSGDQILVTNGVYQTGSRLVSGLLKNRVAVTKSVIVQSVNGPQLTVIQGVNANGGFSATRCVYLADGATLSGFTVAAGGTLAGILSDNVNEGSAGGILCASSSAIVSNCVVKDNWGYYNGGGVYNGTMNNCILSSNSVFAWGGGAYASRLNQCTLTGNRVTSAQGGGGAYGSTLADCTLTANNAALGAGAYGSTLTNCTLSANTAATSGGGAHNSTLKNCVLVGNTAGTFGGGAYSGSLLSCAVNGNSAGNSGGGVYQSTATNCTIVGNSATTSGGGAFNANLRNSILHYNAAPSGSNYSSGTLTYCSTAPLPAGVGNITNDPQLASLTHLSAGSPCVGVGSAAYAKGTDIDGEEWLNPPSVGCDEFRSGAMTGPISVSIEVNYTNLATGLAASFTARIDGRVSAHYWDFADDTTITNRIYFSHAWTNAGDYLVRLVAFNESNPLGVEATVMMHVIPPPIHYVALESANPTAPYISWATAATNIQDAVDAAFLGGIVLVSNGVYEAAARVVFGAMSNRVAVTKPITVTSLNGPAVTTIRGAQMATGLNGDAAVRCVYLANGSSLTGFTITKGATRATGDLVREQSGGGIWMESTNIVVSNCVISGNAASRFGGGAYSGRLSNCSLTGNSAYQGGGAASNLLDNCFLTRNSGSQGGATFSSTLKNCTVTGNFASTGGGINNCTANNCIVYYNTALAGPDWSGGALNYTCTPLPPPSGVGNISLEPKLASASHISGESPCRNAGTPAFASGTDIDGQPWSSPPAVGCDELYSGGATGLLNVSFEPNFTNIAVGFVVDFISDIAGNVTASRWDFGDGTVISNRPYASHSWAAPGDYSVVLSAYNDDHQAGTMTTAVVHVVEQSMHYVATESTNPVSPYISWATAATNLQDAVDTAVVGGTVVVSNGLYQTGTRDVSGTPNRLAVLVPLAVRSVTGPEFTILDGGGSARCVYLTNGASIIGFTLTNGTAGGGGGVWAESRSCIVSNCIIRGNSAGDGGGAARGTLINCILSGNTATLGSGGGANDSALHDCTVSGNSAGFVGGGAINCSLSNCIVTGNTVNDYRGGGVINCTLYNCTLAGNWAFGFNGTAGGAASSVLNNCVIVGNNANQAGGTLYSTLNNCTVVGNNAQFSSSSGGGCWGGIINNSIVYFNGGGNYTADFLGISLNYCSTTPLPSGLGNVTNAPMFIDQAAGDFRLQSSSPCINAGNNAYVTTVTDLGGNPRIVPGAVDMGAYEFQSPSSVLSYAWMQQYALPTDGSIDYNDTDGDGMNNWREWIAGTIPTNSLSRLTMFSPSNSPSGLKLSWQSAIGKTYSLERGTNLSVWPAFSVLQSNIIGQVGTTVFTDSTAINGGGYFYRVGVSR